MIIIIITHKKWAKNVYKVGVGQIAEPTLNIPKYCALVISEFKLTDITFSNKLQLYTSTVLILKLFSLLALINGITKYAPTFACN